jgi:hypothetical protein
MSCRRWEEDLALWVGDDLEAERIPALESHLVTCGDCRELHELLLQSREALRAPSGLEEALDRLGTDLQAGVMAGVAAERRRATAAPWLLLAAALLLAFGALWLWPQGEPPSEVVVTERMSPAPPAPVGHLESLPAEESPPEVSVSEAPEVEQATPPTPRPAPRQSVPRRSAPRVEETPEPPGSEPETVVVQILTERPDLVIYWLVDTPAVKEKNHDHSIL